MGQGIKKLDENVVASGRSFVINNSSVRDNTNFENGTIRCYPSISGLKYKAGANDYRLFDSSNILEQFTIVENLIGNQQISTRTLADLNVTTDKLDNRSVTREKIASEAIGEFELDENAVKTRHITNLNITTDKLDDASVTAEKIKDMNVIAGKLGVSAVLTPNIASSAVTTSKLATGCIVDEKILGNTITNFRLKDLTIEGGEKGKIAEKTITYFNIADKTLTDTQIKDGAITGRLIAPLTINGSNINNNTIETGNIKSFAITSEKIKENAIITDKIADKSITKDKLADDIASSVSNAVVYETDAQGNNCVLIKDNTYMKVLNGDVNINGNLTATRVYNMAYSDLAEGYIPGEELEPGDPVYLREDGMVYKYDSNYVEGIGSCYVGVISDEYAMCLGASDEELISGNKVAVALIGKVHVKTQNLARIGTTLRTPQGQRIGKVLETKEEFDEVLEKGYHKILTLVYP